MLKRISKILFYLPHGIFGITVGITVGIISLAFQIALIIAATLTGTLAQRLECSPMARETWVQSQVESYQRL